MIPASFGKLVSLLSWRKLLLAIALSPLTGFGVGPSDLAYDSGQEGETLATADVERGRLLYETHCIACHTTQAHWRDKHIVRSWADLLYQVTRMEKNAGQDWSSAEISDVAAYLNELFYKMPCPAQGCEGPEASADDWRRSVRNRHLSLANSHTTQPRASDIAPDNAISTRRSRVARAAGMVHRLPPPAV
jgi:hypothetical protein